MRLHLNLTAPVLTLVFALAAPAVFSMENIQPMSSTATRAPLFSIEEWTDIQIGSGIIQDRIKQKQETLSCISKEDTPLFDKMQRCQDDFGVVFYGGPERSIQIGLSRYCGYIEKLLDVYRTANQIVQLLVSAGSQEEKDKHQNNLYYLLSFEAEHFKESIAQFYTHKIPEHSLEDTFYEMISLKLCAKATKKYDVLNEWLIFSCGTRKIDNKKFLEHYMSIHIELRKKFNISHPIFWLGTTHTDIKKLADLQLKSIELQLSQCAAKTIEITNVLCEKINSYKETSVSSAENTIFFYNEFGPLILDTIKGYEAISEKIKKMEKDSTEWLNSFKEKNLFRKIQLEHKKIIREYLQRQKEIELAAQREAERAAALKAQKAPQRKKRINHNKTTVEKLTLTSEPPSKDLTAKQEEKLTQQTAIRTVAKIEDEAKGHNFETLPTPIIIEPVGLSENISSSLPEPIVQPKVKVKTRPNPLNMAIVSVEKTAETHAPLTLPEPFATPEFTSFIENLLAEKNGRKLIKLFKELNTVYGIFSETNEKNNKGYFSIRSPITGKIHVCTYHHLHVTENPYASIFMAVRDVLIAADIIER